MPACEWICHEANAARFSGLHALQALTAGVDSVPGVVSCRGGED